MWTTEETVQGPLVLGIDVRLLFFTDLLSLPRGHKEFLAKFTQQLRSNSERKDIRFVGLGRVGFGGISVDFVNQLIDLSHSVGIIRAQMATKNYAGTVFRVGPCHVMTCCHVVKDIHGKLN